MSPIRVSTAPTLYSLERGADLFLGIVLAFRAAFQEVDHVRTLRGIAEVVADGRFEDLGHEVDHAAEARDHLGRVVARECG